MYASLYSVITVSLFQVMACHLFSTKPFPEAMMTVDWALSNKLQCPKKFVRHGYFGWHNLEMSDLQWLVLKWNYEEHQPYLPKCLKCLKRVSRRLQLQWNLNFNLNIFTGGHRTRVAAVTLDNMAERVFAQREDLPWFFGVNYWFSWYFW